MKLLRYGSPGEEKPGLFDSSDAIRDLSGVVPDIAGDTLLPASIAKLSRIDPASLPRVSGTPRIGPCVGRVGKFICIGLNYSDHAAESGMAVPKEPIVFLKATSAIIGPNDNIEIPRGSQKTDWEVELAVVIGKPAKYVTEQDAMSHVAGYCVAHDVSERAYQLEGTGQWTKGKSADTFGPIGPWLVTADEIPEPENLNLQLDVNGERRQQGNTRQMIRDVPGLIEYASSFYTLYPGDIFLSGTPAGVGPMKPGDELEATIEKVGTMRVKVRAA